MAKSTFKLDEKSPTARPAEAKVSVPGTETKGDKLSMNGQAWSFSREPAYQRVLMDLGLL